ncbi:hypothetical protein FRC07_006658 [Ceratobasidium sp. 392]|nr:hypothetical protein FRC07_006658 [Ceratobasidium sp. 392]
MATQRRIHSLSGRMDDQKRLIFAISQSDDISVGRIVQTALRNGAGVDTIINRLARAQQGLFSPHMYSQKSFDIAALVLKVGGPRLAFAVAKAMHLPSISAVRSRLDLPQLRPSVGFPTKAEVLANIEASFGAHNTSSNSHIQAGLVLQMDELALEPRLRYSIHQDTVVGIAREDASLVSLENLSTRSDALDALLETKKLLDSGKCRRATEATMAAIARFGPSDYNPAVILASGTCKTEKAPDQARLIRLILECWKESPYGEAVHGGLWSVCTDGDAGRRRALFQLCMSSQLPKSSDLFRLIGHLPLLNLHCGPDYVTHDGDYKHEEKRLASAMRSRSGLLVNGAHITPKMLVKYLRCLDNLPESRILSFFDGTDPQNVPKANALLTHLHKASQLPLIASRPENKPFVLLGEVIGSFVYPYITPTMSLTEQVTSLAKCGHLLYALYRIDGTKFLPGQLIYDIQASIKNAVFCVAKTQLVSPELPFYLLQTGTDRLESRFGTYRTTTSDRNGDILQMSERAGSAQQIDEIFSAHKEWNRTPYRLSLDGRSGVDHTNPSSWTGDVIVGHVDLHAAWIDGQSQAAAVLRHAGVPFEFDPAVLSSGMLEIDLMRPTGVYPGIQTDSIELIPQSVPISELTDDISYLESEESQNSDCSTQSLTTSNAFQRLGDDELGIEHLLPPVPDNHSTELTKRGWLPVNDKHVHLESAVRYLLGADGGAKSTDRLRRVCGYTRYLHPSASETNSVLGDDFHVSELVATFLRAENQLVLGIIRVTDIVASDGRSLESISDKQFGESGVTLSGQLLELEYDSGTWYWTQRYDLAAETTASKHRKRHLGFDFGARFAYPVNPALVERHGEHVWAFERTQLRELMDTLWSTCASRSPEDHIPTCQPSVSFPYREFNSTF